MKKGALILGAAIVFLVLILTGGIVMLDWSVEWAIRIGILGLVGSTLFFVVRWHAGNFGYECLLCGHKFAVSTLTDFVSPHYPDKKSLKCPVCHQRSSCREIPPSAVPAKAESICLDK